MAKFYTSSNNGVVAVISEEHAHLYGLILKAEGKPPLAGCRVFTFCSKDRIEKDSMQKMVMTGTIDDWRILMEAGGHEMAEGAITDWDGYVPFSNGIEYSNDDVARYRELLYVTTLSDVIDAFGIKAIMRSQQ